MNSSIYEMNAIDNNITSWNYDTTIQRRINSIPNDELGKWNKQDIKDFIRDKLQIHQKNSFDQKLRCSLCSSRLGVTSDGDIEHFVPKGKFPHFTYEIKNLSLACTKCNQIEKRVYVSIDEPYNTQYENNIFNLIHPIFDKNSDHLIRVINQSNRVVLIKQKNGSIKGNKTIELLNLNAEARQDDRFIEYIAASQNKSCLYKKLYDLICYKKDL